MECGTHVGRGALDTWLYAAVSSWIVYRIKYKCIMPRYYNMHVVMWWMHNSHLALHHLDFLRVYLTCIYKYIHTNTHTHYTHTHTHTHTHTTHIHTYVYMHAYIHTYMKYYCQNNVEYNCRQVTTGWGLKLKLLVYEALSTGCSAKAPSSTASTGDLQEHQVDLQENLRMRRQQKATVL